MPKPRRPPPLKRDHARPRTAPAPSNAAVEARLTNLVSPAAFALGDEYRRLGLRNRTLALPVMVAVVLTIVWRQVPAVSDAVRLLVRERLLWVPAGLRVSQQALSQRLRALPESLFAGLWAALAPTLQARAAARARPLPAVVARVRAHYPRIWAIDGSTLEELFKRVGLLRDEPQLALGGTVEAALDLATKLPVHLWLDPDPAANDKRFLDRIKLVRLGAYRSNPCAHPVRLVEIQVGGTWRAYLTNVLDPAVLPVTDVVALYARRWQVEEAFLLTKRLLGLSYLWSGAWNAIALQVWATWLLYGVLVDLSDTVAEELDQPLDAISLEMVYRGLYHFAGAFQRGEATDPVAYLAAQPDLGIVKRRRKYRERARADLDAWHQELNL